MDNSEKLEKVGEGTYGEPTKMSAEEKGEIANAIMSNKGMSLENWSEVVDETMRKIENGEMTFQEKCDIICTIIFDSKGMFQLRELQEMENKTGVPTRDVKKVLERLVEDDLVRKATVGTLALYWPATGCRHPEKKRLVLLKRLKVNLDCHLQILREYVIHMNESSAHANMKTLQIKHAAPKKDLQEYEEKESRFKKMVDLLAALLSEE